MSVRLGVAVLVPLLLAAAPVPPSDAPRGGRASQRPPAASAATDVAALVRRCVEAHGGEAALVRSAAAVQQGSVTSLLHPGVVGRIGRAYGRPGRLRVEIDFAGDGEIRLLDGGRGFRHGREVDGALRDSMILQAARMDLPALLSASVARVERVGTEVVAGRTLPLLALELAPGLRVEAAIDPESGRVLRSRGRSSGKQPVEFATTYSDFRQVDGVLVPFHEENFANGRITGETRLDSVEFPRELPADLFRPDGAR